jgi:hypothetical protein
MLVFLVTHNTDVVAVVTRMLQMGGSSPVLQQWFEGLLYCDVESQ